jgi:hypothetical protein
MGDEAGSHGSMARSGNITPRGVDFLENWIATNLSSDTKPADAHLLAMRCVLEAAALGITYDEMESDWGSVEEAITQAIRNLPGMPMTRTDLLHKVNPMS